MKFRDSPSFRNALAFAGLAVTLVAIFFSTPFARALPFAPAPPSSGAQTSVLTTRPGPSDERFGVVVTDNNDIKDTLDLLGLSWYLDYSVDASSAPPGSVKALKLRTNPPPEAGDVQAIARSYPGGYWIIGNEPNGPSEDDSQPEAYARLLREYALLVKDADPDARVAGPEILNFDSTCAGCPGFPSGRRWLEGLFEAYQRLYGEAPPLDIWTIHTYDLNWERLPQGDYRVQADDIMAFRDFLDSIPSERGKPIWLTEFSVVWAFDGIRWQVEGDKVTAQPVGGLRSDRLHSYLESMVSWLQDNATALNLQHWFLFATHQHREQWAAASGGIGLLEGTGRGARLTELGTLYRNLARTAAAGRVVGATLGP